MKIYAGPNHGESNEYTYVSNVFALNQAGLDGEVKEIVADRFLSGFTIHEIPKVIDIMVNKLRLNGQLIITDKDFDIFCLKHYRDDMNLQEINLTLFDVGAVGCALDIEYVSNLIKDRLFIEEESLNHTDGTFVIKARRLS